MATQQPLFAGLDCLPGQEDLFATDGEFPHDPPADVVLIDENGVSEDDAAAAALPPVDEPDQPPERLESGWWCRVAGVEIGPSSTKAGCQEDYRRARAFQRRKDQPGFICSAEG